MRTLFGKFFREARMDDECHNACDINLRILAAIGVAFATVVAAFWALYTYPRSQREDRQQVFANVIFENRVDSYKRLASICGQIERIHPVREHRAFLLAHDQLYSLVDSELRLWADEAVQSEANAYRRVVSDLKRAVTNPDGSANTTQDSIDIANKANLRPISLMQACRKSLSTSADINLDQLTSSTAQRD